MKLRLTIPLMIAGVLLLAGCAAPGMGDGAVDDEQNTQNAGQESAYHKIDPETAKEMMDEGNVTIVDVRTSDEYDEGHIPGAVLVPNESIGKEMPEDLPDQDAVLLVYCRSGRRSKDASDKLIEMGYKNVYDFGGITDWPYETEQ